MDDQIEDYFKLLNLLIFDSNADVTRRKYIGVENLSLGK